MIAREGYTTIALAAGITLAAVPVVWFWLGPRYWLVILPFLVLLAFVLFFFRDPERVPPPDDDGSLLLAPADGKVIEITEEDEPIYLEERTRRLSIFLSPLDVHVNRIPASGVIEHAQYIPGKYLVAWHPKSSEENERSIVGLRHASGRRILFKQIAGAVARRVVFDVKVKDRVEAGDRFGIVKFGSRMDVLVPLDVTFSVTEGDRVKGGTSVIGRIPTQPAKHTDVAEAETA